MPQTWFVLNKALEGQNKWWWSSIKLIDCQDARGSEVLDEIYDLFIDLDANEEQLEFLVLYGIGKDGIAKYELADRSADLHPLLDTIKEKLLLQNIF